jgi:acetyl esterase/lipase
MTSRFRGGRAPLMDRARRGVGAATPAEPPESANGPAAPGSPGPGRSRLEVAYAAVSTAQRLDLHLPPAADPTPVPLVVAIHGGAFAFGDKGDVVRRLVDPLTAAGFAVASLNYRLSGEASFPAPVQDVKAAVRWLRAHAPEHGIDPDRIGAIGESAGGYLATMLGVTGGLDTFDDPALGNPGVSSAVRAVVDLYGPVNFSTMDDQLRSNPRCRPGDAVHNAARSPESLLLGRQITEAAPLVRAACPLTYLSRDAPPAPFLIEHGDADCTVPFQQSEELADGLVAIGAPARLTILRDAGHADDFPLPRRMPGILEFLADKLRAGPA